MAIRGDRENVCKGMMRGTFQSGAEDEEAERGRGERQKRGGRRRGDYGQSPTLAFPRKPCWRSTAARTDADPPPDTAPPRP